MFAWKSMVVIYSQTPHLNFIRVFVCNMSPKHIRVVCLFWTVIAVEHYVQMLLINVALHCIFRRRHGHIALWAFIVIFPWRGGGWKGDWNDGLTACLAACLVLRLLIWKINHSHIDVDCDILSTFTAVLWAAYLSWLRSVASADQELQRGGSLPVLVGVWSTHCAGLQSRDAAPLLPLAVQHDVPVDRWIVRKITQCIFCDILSTLPLPLQ